MEHYAGIDVSLEYSSVCVVDASGKIVREAKVESEPSALTDWFTSLGFGLSRIGLEAGPLSQWLFAGMRSEGLEVEPDGAGVGPLVEDHVDAKVLHGGVEVLLGLSGHAVDYIDEEEVAATQARK